MSEKIINHAFLKAIWESKLNSSLIRMHQNLLICMIHNFQINI